jgi:hypothetical protein
MKITKFEPKEGINAKAHRKENHFTDEYVVLDLTTNDNPNCNRTIITVRFYHTPTTSYCCLWIRVGDIHSGWSSCSGSGKATGYGYHRESQAFENALRSAGIEFDEGIGGRGNSIYNEILLRIASKLEFIHIYTHHSHA